jgi:hypothetical protein
VQLYYYNRALASDNMRFTVWKSILCAQFAQSLNIVTTSFLYIKLLIDSLESCFLRVDDVRRREGYGSNYANSNQYPGGSYPKQVSSSGDGPLQPKLKRNTLTLAKGRSNMVSMKSPLQSPRWPLGDDGMDLPDWEHTLADVITETKSWTIENHAGSAADTDASRAL